MASRTNPQAKARRRAGKRLQKLINRYSLPLKKIAKDTGIDMLTLQNLETFTPHLRTIEKIAKYIEGIARERSGGIRKQLLEAATSAAVQPAADPSPES